VAAPSPCTTTARACAPTRARACAPARVCARAEAQHPGAHELPRADDEHEQNEGWGGPNGASGGLRARRGSR